ncbi:hypothetical protein OPT61_g4072 [Boeremia exigua]|uniref:Uncharacterized protein n=1 Tax=Boeremia exigua TaxID=749465 RepID=A0ACC2IFJ3_9PLEO|nr:hypothetical protein OPT61_g4072 [Boeremia exigua]
MQQYLNSDSEEASNHVRVANAVANAIQLSALGGLQWITCRHARVHAAAMTNASRELRECNSQGRHSISALTRDVQHPFVWHWASITPTFQDIVAAQICTAVLIELRARTESRGDPGPIMSPSPQGSHIESVMRKQKHARCAGESPRNNCFRRDLGTGSDDYLGRCGRLGVEETRKLLKHHPEIFLTARRPFDKAVKINSFTVPSAAGAPSPRANGTERQTLTTVNVQQVPASPSVQQSPVTHASPSTLGIAGSPLQISRPLIANANGSVEATVRRQETTRMRSSIACSRCRRSKTKCDNNGIRDSTGALAPCKSCAAGNKVCDYPAPQPANSHQPHRRESTATAAGGEAPSKKRKRPAVPVTANGPSQTNPKLGPHEDALNSPLLTPKVWEELWAIHEKHYAMEFPFLHKRTFLGALMKLPPLSSAEVGSTLPDKRIHDQALVLAFLALTSPFHEELVAQTDSSYNTAEFYATAGRLHLSYDFEQSGEAGMRQIQAFLMLGYHEWTACHGRRGYMLIRVGVNLAQMNDYQYDEDIDKGHEGKDAASKRDCFIQEESRRRTFWSCFILDRYLSVGRRRPKMLRIENKSNTIQIPCSDKNFFSGRAVRTRFFGETDLQYRQRREETNDKTLQRIEWEDREDDGMLGRYIFALDHFSDVTKWANEGGRRSEPPGIGPWNPDSTYYKLDKRLREIREDLPEELRLTSINTENHVYGVASATSRTYFLVHAILMLSTTYLAPEYLPTFGFRLTKPQGPMDEPLVTEALPADQPDYWVDKAKECFEHVSDFVSVLQSFKDRGLVVESPFVGHAVWRAAWAAMYCHHVPKMDPSNALNSKLEPNAWDITNQVLDSMKMKFRIANIYSAQLATVADDYAEKRRAWRNNGGSPLSPFSDTDGGLHEYSVKFETAHKQFGSLQAEGKDLAQPDGKIYSRLSKLEHEEELEDPTTPNPGDKTYSRLSRLEHEEELEDPATPHSHVVTYKTEVEEPRRSASTSISMHSAGFTTINGNNAAVPAQREQVGVQPEPGNGTRPYGASTQGIQPQSPQSYPGQPLPYGQVYDYSNNTPAYQSQYGVAASYAQTPGPSQGPGSGSYDPHALMLLEKEGNQSLRNNDVNFFELETSSIFCRTNRISTCIPARGRPKAETMSAFGGYDVAGNRLVEHTAEHDPLFGQVFDGAQEKSLIETE